MKKIITPKQEEKAVYICDVTGIEMQEDDFFDKSKPRLGCIIILNTNYGAKWDGLYNNKFHLSEEVTKEVIEFLAEKYAAQRLLKLNNYSQDETDNSSRII